MGNPEGIYYEQPLGVGCGRIATDPDGENSVPAVSIMFPKKFQPYPDDPEHEENFDEVFLSINAAKSLLVDLRDAVDGAISGEGL